MPEAMPSKTPVNCCGESCRSVGNHKTKHACIDDAEESMRTRMEGSHHKNHEDHIAGKSVNSLSHYNLVHTLIPVPGVIGKLREYRHGS